MRRVKGYDFFVHSLNNRSLQLEYRLLMFFITAQVIWAGVNLVRALTLPMPMGTIISLAVIVILLPLYFLVGHITGKMKYFANLYFIIYLFALPVIWYFLGGNQSNANVLFVCELVVFTMCLNGVRQKIMIVLSIISSGAISAASGILGPRLIYPMTDMQRRGSGSVLGLSTSVLIMALLIRQKTEYMKERDAAITSEKELEKSNKLQKNFLANMSHEIRSPLGVVLGFNNLIKDSNSVEEIHEYSANITKAGRTLQTVINDILDYSKIESGKLDIINDNYSFNDLMKDIKRDVKLKCSEKGLMFDSDIDEKIPEYLYGDNIRLKQCILNLLFNAVKYTDKGRVILQATLVSIEGDECVLKFAIRDTGRGIAEEAIPNLFTAFKRLDEGHNRGIEGTGLGLAITKNLLDEMNGDIEVTSTLGKGSSFVITIGQKIGEEVVTAQVDHIDISGVKILAVDDMEVNLVIINRLLEKDGAVVTTVTSGKECLNRCRNEKFDIILLDHMMPEMDGVETFRQLRERGIETPVVMLTANAMAGAAKEYESYGFDAYVSKPFVPEELIYAVRRCVNMQN